jgi:hypothetical protein
MKKMFVSISVLLAVLIVAALSAVFYLRSMAHGFSARGSPLYIETMLAEYARATAMPASARNMRNPIALTPEVEHEALAHYADHCAVCHANNGSGDTMFGRGLYPKPPDLRAAHTQQMTDGELYYTIKNGVRLSGMPAFGEPGDDDLASWKLVVFIRHLPSLTQDEEMKMEQLNPKTPEEIEEEQQEENFLNGGSSTQPQPHHHPKGAEQQ